MEENEIAGEEMGYLGDDLNDLLRIVFCRSKM